MSNVAGIADPDSDPSRFRQHVMSFGLSRPDELVANPNGKRQIGPSAAVQVSEFASTHSKLDTAESMGFDRHVRPRRDFTNDLLVEAFGHVLFDARLKGI